MRERPSFGTSSSDTRPVKVSFSRITGIDVPASGEWTSRTRSWNESEPAAGRGTDSRNPRGAFAFVTVPRHDGVGRLSHGSTQKLWKSVGPPVVSVAGPLRSDARVS